MENLKCLDASVNSLESIPDEIKGLVKLTALYLSQNNLDKLPDNIGRTSN